MPPNSISQIKADLKRKYNAQLQQTESEIIEEYTQALAERDNIRQLDIEELRTNLSHEHKLQLDKKANNIHANYAGILNKKETELQNLTSELYDANQLIRKLKNSTRPQQYAFEDPKNDAQAKLRTKIRNIQSNNAGIIAKKDAQYQRLSKELENAHQVEDAYQAELALTKREHESEKVQLRKDLEAEHGAEIEALRETQGREMAALKSEYAEIAAKLEANHGFLQQNFEAWEASHGALETNHRSLQQNCEALLHAQQDGVVVEGGISKSEHSAIVEGINKVHEKELQQVRALNGELVKVVTRIETVCGKVRSLDIGSEEGV